MLSLFTRTKATDDYDDVLRSGIFFHQESMIVLFEKIKRLNFSPLPKYNFELNADFAELISKVDKWRTPSAFCPLEFSVEINSTDSPFNVIWLWAKINDEVILVQRETDLIRNETAELLYKPKEKSNRVRRDDGSALGLFGLFGPGVLLTGIGGSCGTLGVFGIMQRQI